MSTVIGDMEMWDPSNGEAYGFIGQSNRAGSSTQVQSTATGLAIWRGSVLTEYSPSPAPQPATYTSGQTTYGSLASFSAARGVPVMALLLAIGGTRMVVDAAADAYDGSVARWDPTAGRLLSAYTGLTGVAGDLYRGALDLWTYAGQPELKAWMRYQGEQEADLGSNLGRTYQQTYDLYHTALTAFVTALWDDTGIPTVITPISKCYDHTADPGITRMLPIYDAQVAVAASHAHAYLGAETSDLDLMHTHGDAGNLHIYDVSTLGTREAAAITTAGL